MLKHVQQRDRYHTLSAPKYISQTIFPCSVILVATSFNSVLQALEIITQHDLLVDKILIIAPGTEQHKLALVHKFAKRFKIEWIFSNSLKITSTQLLYYIIHLSDQIVIAQNLAYLNMQDLTTCLRCLATTQADACYIDITGQYSSLFKNKKPLYNCFYKSPVLNMLPKALTKELLVKTLHAAPSNKPIDITNLIDSQAELLLYYSPSFTSFRL
jgi:hypothetical protein